MRSIVSVCLILCLLATSACQSQQPPEPTHEMSRPTAVGVTLEPSAPPANSEVGEIEAIGAEVPASFRGSSSGVFARFSPAEVRAEGRVQAPTIAPDLSNVAVTTLLSPEQQSRIAQNGFAVSPGATKEFYELYERARYDYIPVFVSSDSLLHVYHLLFDKMLRRAETQFFIPMLARLDWEMLRASAEQYEALKGTPWAEAARRNAAYFAVAVKVLSPEWDVPEGLRDLVEPELERIAAHNEIGPSAIFPAYPGGEDWSQYAPRGHYTRSEDLERYFVAMMWHGRMTFRASDPIETQQAALLTLAFNRTMVGQQTAQQIWSGIYEPTVFFVGRSDDLLPEEYTQALNKAYGQVGDVKDLVDDAKFGAFRAAIEELHPPEILGMVVDPGAPDVEASTKGLRFMGQRFVPDAFVFRQLIADAVPSRSLPKALDFFAALGADRALTHLESSGDTALPNYQQNMQKLRDIFASYEEEVWTQNLYWSWIHSLRPLLEPVGEGYPQFMRSEAWLDKQLTTALGSWTELKRDTILYAKQVYAEGGGGTLPPPVPEPPKGYVEPVPLLYARVGALAQMTLQGLDDRGLLSEQDKPALEAMVKLCSRLQTIAEKELSGEAPTAEEYEFIRFYGAEIESLTFFAADDEAFYAGRGGTPVSGDPLEAAVVADVATDPGGSVLEEGVGRIFEIYVVAPIEGRLVLTKGGVFSHYEFVQPLSERLTDEAWRKMLDAGKSPALAAWTGSFMVEQTINQPLAERIFHFNEQLIQSIWFSDMGFVEPYLADPELSDTRTFVDELKSQQQFVGMKLLGLQFLSFDFQDEQHATVTTRERWSDELYRGSPKEERTSEPVKVGVRGPYEIVVTYTMERRGEDWVITRIVTRPEPPSWQQP